MNDYIEYYNIGLYVFASQPKLQKILLFYTYFIQPLNNVRLYHVLDFTLSMLPWKRIPCQLDRKTFENIWESNRRINSMKSLQIPTTRSEVLAVQTAGNILLWFCYYSILLIQM